MARPKNRTTILLEREIRKLEQQIADLQAELDKRPALSLSEDSQAETVLPYKGYVFFKDKRGKIDMVELRLDMEKEIVKFGERKTIADFLPRAMLEIKKLVAHEELFNKEA